MDIKRSKKIHIVVEEEPVRKASKIPIVEPETDNDPFFRRIIVRKPPEPEINANLAEPEFNIRKFFERTEGKIQSFEIPKTGEIRILTGADYNSFVKTVTEKVSPAERMGIELDNLVFQTTTGRIKKNANLARAEARLRSAVNEQINPNDYWVTSDGYRILIKEMSDPHLINTIRFLLTKANIANYGMIVKESYEELVAQYFRIPSDFYAKSLTDFENDWICKDVFKVYPKLQFLFREAAKRGLSLLKKDKTNPKKKRRGK